MAHDTHFLTRLERAGPGEVELALGLYRDPELVSELLSSSRTAQGAERIAISLGEGSTGPWAVVAANGHFVTCLAADMKHDLPVVGREQVAAVAARVQKIRAYTEEAKRLTGIAEAGGRCTALMRILYSARDCLSREDFRALASLEPVLGVEFLTQYIDNLLLLGKTRPALDRAAGHRNHASTQVLDRYAELLWSVGPLAVLSTMAGPRRVELLSPSVRSGFAADPIMTVVLHQRLGTLWLEGLWAAAKLGKHVLPAYKRAFTEPDSGWAIYDGAFALTVLALRHGGLEAEVRKTLRRLPTLRQGAKPFALDIAPKCRHLFEQILDAREKNLREHRSMGAGFALLMTKHLPKGHPFAFEREEDVPDEIAFPLVLSRTMDPFDGDQTWFHVMRMALPFLARAEADELFLPKAFLEATSRPFTAEEMRAHALATRLKQTPLQSARSALPNEPCPCGSGKKHKRCCAGKSAA